MSQPWLDEPNDELFESHGLKCAIHRVEWSGHLCGYVGVPKTHPLYGKSYSDLVKVDPQVFERKIDMDRVGVLNLFCASAKNNEDTIKAGLIELSLVLECHGGLTYADKPFWSDDKESDWYFGFDAAHSGDRSPKRVSYGDRVYRTFEYMKNEVISLAKQLSEWPND